MTSGNKGESAPLGRPADQSVKLLLRDGWDRLLEGDGLIGRIATFVLIVLLAGGSGMLLGPRGHQAIPYDADDLGRFAVGTVKAHRNYRIEDLEATQHKRQEARETVLAVYDYEVDAVEQITRRVREAFIHMQRVWREQQLEIAARVEHDSVSRGESSDSSAEPDENLEFDRVREVASRLASVDVFSEHKDTFLQRLQLPIDDASFDQLAGERFSPDIERAVTALVRHGMSRPIIADQQLLAADRMRGITLRPVPVRDLRSERVLRDVVGEVRDLATARSLLNERMDEVLPDAADSTRALVGRLARRLVRPTVFFNRDETERRRDLSEASVRATFIELEAGEKVIGDGERIEPRHLVIFQGMRDQAAASSSRDARIGAALLAILTVLSLMAFASSGVWRFRPSRKDLLFLLTTLLGTLLAVRGGMFLADALADRLTGASGSMLYYALPAGAAVVLVRLVLTGEITLVFAVVLSVLVGVMADHTLGYALFTLIGGLVAAQRVRKARDRSGIWQAGSLMAVVNVLLVAAIGMQEGRELVDFYPALISAGAAGAVTPVLVLGLAILVENVFRYTTDLKLLELANMNNRLLKELVVAAPGTYHHSMLIGSMVEAAAEAIGANPLLARVGAYYHDIGKGKNPLYFAENQKGENPHDKLSPSMSALIIRRHVIDGVKMAKVAGLPQPLIDMIPMHHGTRLMAYFWHRAKEECEKKSEQAPLETDYRYAGPKPRFREAALLMIADSVEAAARTLTEPTTDRLRGLVQKVINACFADGQFDECNITLKDLHAITRSFVTSLEAIYHSRPEYHQPADKVADKKNGEKGRSEGRAAERQAQAEAASPKQPSAGSNTNPESLGESLAAQKAHEQLEPSKKTRDEESTSEDKNASSAQESNGPQQEVDALAAGKPPVPAEDDGLTRHDEQSLPPVEVLKRLGTG